MRQTISRRPPQVGSVRRTAAAVGYVISGKRDKSVNLSVFCILFPCGSNRWNNGTCHCVSACPPGRTNDCLECGGSVALVLIYDMLCNLSNPLTTHCLGASGWERGRPCLQNVIMCMCVWLCDDVYRKIIDAISCNCTTNAALLIFANVSFIYFAILEARTTTYRTVAAAWRRWHGERTLFADIAAAFRPTRRSCCRPCRPRWSSELSSAGRRRRATSWMKVCLCLLGVVNECSFAYEYGVPCFA